MRLARSQLAMMAASPLVGRISPPCSRSWNYDRQYQEPQETVVRALSDTTQTRTWGLLIDVIAQSGKYAPGETDLRKFTYGEQHYWVHVAIDRFTGWVIDKQIEVVNE